LGVVVLDDDLSNAHKKSKIKIFTSASYIEVILNPLMEALLSVLTLPEKKEIFSVGVKTIF
jgi:hypothetical protein